MVTCLNRWRVVWALALVAGLGPWVPRAKAQAVAVAEVSGQITDPTGSAVPGATVKMTDEERGVVHTTVSNAAGRYALPDLPVGHYRFEATATGCKTFLQTGIQLQAGNNVQINALLQLGSISETLEVQASVGMVETKDNAISQVIDDRRINDLPLNGRQATQLILISGASAPTPAGNMTGSKNFYSSVTISIAGGQGNGLIIFWTAGTTWTPSPM